MSSLPDEIGFLSRIFELCAKENDTRDEMRGQATFIVALYMSGFTDETELLALAHSGLSMRPLVQPFRSLEWSGSVKPNRAEVRPIRPRGSPSKSLA